MALVLKDRVRETSTSTGTGTITLAGAVTGFQSFSAIGSGNTTFYTITMAGDWEVGIGTYTSPNQLSRDTVLESSNSNALVPFGSGTKDVFATFPAEGFDRPPAIGGTTPNTITGTTVTATDLVGGSPSSFVINDGANSGVDCTFGIDQTTLNPYITATDGLYNYPLQLNDGVTFPIGVNLSLNNTNSLIFSTSTAQTIYITPPTTTTGGGYTLTLPTSAGSNNQVLKTDGSGNLSWLDFGSPPAIGGTTPNTGKFTTLTTTSNATLAAIADPSAPSNGNVAIYGRSYGGYNTLAARNALNTPFGLQSALWSKNIMMWTTTAATAGVWLNGSGAGNGTFTNVNPTTGATKYQSIRRSTYANVITTLNQLLGQTAGQQCFFRGGTAGQGGFFFYTRCGFDVWTNGGRFFAGMTTGTTVASADPSSTNNTVGFCVDAADAGAISFLTRGTAATKASTGLTITSNKGYDIYIYCASNSSQYTWEIVDINTGTAVTGTATANLPTNTQLQFPYVLASNAALTPATSISLGIAKIYIETDY